MPVVGRRSTHQGSQTPRRVGWSLGFDLRHRRRCLNTQNFLRLHPHFIQAADNGFIWSNNDQIIRATEALAMRTPNEAFKLAA